MWLAMQTVHDEEDCDQAAYPAALLTTDWYTVRQNVSIIVVFCTSKHDIIDNKSVMSSSNNDFINCQSQIG
jgi:hypothetical protein